MTDKLHKKALSWINTEICFVESDIECHEIVGGYRQTKNHIEEYKLAKKHLPVLKYIEKVLKDKSISKVKNV